MGSSVQPTTPLATLISACKGAGMDVSDAERFECEYALTGHAHHSRAAYAALVVTAMGAGWIFAAQPYGSHGEYLCSRGVDGEYGPTAADALYKALGGKL